MVDHDWFGIGIALPRRLLDETRKRAAIEAIRRALPNAERAYFVLVCVRCGAYRYIVEHPKVTQAVAGTVIVVDVCGDAVQIGRSTECRALAEGEAG